MKHGVFIIFRKRRKASTGRSKSMLSTSISRIDRQQSELVFTQQQQKDTLIEDEIVKVGKVRSKCP